MGTKQQEELQLARGSTFRIFQDGVRREYEFARQAGYGNLIFIDTASGRPTTFEAVRFAKMIHEKLAVQIRSTSLVERTDIHAFMDATLPGTPAETRRKIIAAQTKMAEAAMYLFHVKAFDAAAGSYGLGMSGLLQLIEDKRSDALRAGHLIKPSYSALYRAIQKGQPNDRQLADYVSLRGSHSKRKWTDLWVVRALEEAVDLYYSEGDPKPVQLQEVVNNFLRKAIDENRARLASGRPQLKSPKRTAVENHIRGQETYDRLKLRDPTKAERIYNSRSEGAKASFPLEHVQVDQTQIDTWINIYDENGNVEDRKRPYLVSIIDVYSRMILAAILTFDKPSSYTVQLAIKQMLRPKQFLIDRFGLMKGATDGSGQPKGMTFDNGVENAGITMRTLLHDGSVDMDLAPRAVPKAKAIVERGFETYNKALWHSAPGGIPYKPHELSARRLTPQEKAQWALDFATGVMWHWIVNVHHFNRNRTLEAMPVRLWVEKIGDPMVGRSVSKRLDLVDVICGTRLRLRINGAGVLHDTHVFHHPKITADLLIAMSPKDERSKRGRYGKISVEAIVYPYDCSHIYIVDNVRNRYIRLPNTKPIFAAGLSYAEAAMIRATDRALDRPYISEEELILAKDNFFQMRERTKAVARAERAIRLGKKAAKAAADEELVEFSFVAGARIEFGEIEPTVRGDAPFDVPQDMAALQRRSTGLPHKDEPRGAKKAAATRETNRQLAIFRKQVAAENVPPPQRAISPQQIIPTLSNPSDFLDALANDLD